MSMNAAPMNDPAAQGAPPPDAAPSPEDVMAAQEQEAMAQMEAIAAAAPPPTEPFQKKRLEKLVGAVNKLANAVADEMGLEEDPPQVELSEAVEAKHNAPMPPELFVPFAMLMDAVRQYDEKLFIDPMTVRDNGAVLEAVAKVEKAARDKEFVASLAPAAPEEGAADAAPPPPPPTDNAGLAEDEQALMAQM